MNKSIFPKQSANKPVFSTNRLCGILSLIALCCGLTAGTGAEAADAANPVPETAAQHDAKMAWWRDARFGMFIHWGLYSVAAGEWRGKSPKTTAEWIQHSLGIPTSQYQTLVAQFDPEQFDARRWVRIAKDAGMKYIVITAKHHDGFGLFPSSLTDWCIKSTPFKRDPLRELAAACKSEGVRFCCYYSIMDWHHPDWGQRESWNDLATGKPDMDRYVAYMKGQLSEIITNYHPAVLWFDGEWESAWTHERAVDLDAFLRRLDPNLVINNRIDKARVGMAGMNGKANALGDYGTPEQTIPGTGFGPGVDWETCMTMNDTWGFNKSDTHWKSPQTIIRNLINVASKGGNYLLNVGPTGEGLIPGASVERLAVVGQWMKVNGKSIYGTQASPFAAPLPWGRCTSKYAHGNTTLYLHVFDWPADGKLLVPGLRNKVKSARLLAGPNKGSLPVQAAESGLIISLPAAAPDAISSTVVLRLKGAPTESRN
jgi:alpha-L-fucosidase